MSRTIDDKVVELEFDNAQFERGVKESMSTLERLKQALDMSPLGSSIEAVQVKFSAFDAFVKRILENIADTAYNTGKRLIKSLSVDQIGAGWTKFADKTSAVQTIMSATSQTWEDSANVITRANHLMEQGLDEILAQKMAQQYKEVSAGVKSVADAAKELGVTPEYFEATARGLDEIAYSGSQMDYVSEQLAKLTWFTDETSYSFMDMVNNIGKFTANQVPLEQAVTSMQGISTWAAASGANVNEAGRAMYNLSQAIAVGSVKLNDWKSIEDANMSTAEFKQIAIDTAVALGTLVDKGDGVYETMKGNEVSVKNFNSALSDAWFSSEVLLATLDKYGGFAEKLQEISDETGLTATTLLGYIHDFKDGNLDIEATLEAIHEETNDTSLSAERLQEIMSELGDESYDLGMRAFEAAQAAKTFEDVINYVKEAVSTGWMNTFEYIFGNYEEAKKLWSDLAEELYGVFVESGEVRNDMLKTWKETYKGRDDLVEAFWNIFHAVTDTIGAIKKAFREIFPRMTAERLKAFTERLRDFTKLIAITDQETGELNERGEKIKTTFKGVFAVLRTLKDIAIAVLKPVKNLFAGAGGGFLDLSSNIGELLIKFDAMVHESGVLEKITTRLGGAFSAVNEFVRNMIDIFKGVSFWEGGGGISGIFQSIFDGVNNAVKLFFDVFSSLTGKDLSTIRDKVTGTISKIRDLIVSGLGPISGILQKLKSKITDAIKAVKDAFNGFKGINTSGPEEFASKTNKIFKPLVTLFEGLKKIFSAIMAGVKKLMPLVSAAIIFIGKMLGEIGSALANAIKNANMDSLFDIFNNGAFAVMGVGIAKFISNLSGVASSVKGVVKNIKALTGGLNNALKAYKNDKQANIVLKIAGAIGILAVSAMILSSIDAISLTNAVTAIGGLMFELTLAMQYMSKLDTRSMKKVGTVMIGLSAAVLILASAVKKLSALSWEELAKGLIGTAGLLTGLVISIRALSTGNDTKMLKGATNAVIFAGAIRILASAMKSMATLGWGELAVGLVGMVAAVAVMIIAAKMLSGESVSSSLGIKGVGKASTSIKPDKMMKGALNALIFAGAIRVLASVVKTLAKMSWGDLAKGLVGMGVVIAEIVIAAKILGGESVTSFATGAEGTSFSKAKPNSMLKGAVNALIFAAALKVLVSVVRAIGSMDLRTLGVGLGGLAVLLTEIIISSKIMSGSGGATAGLIAAATAMIILGGALKILATISWGDLLKGLAAFAGFIAVIGLAGYLLGGAVSFIFALSEAMALFGVGILAIGAGLFLVSLALETFGIAIEVAVAAIIKALYIIIEAIPGLLAALADSLAKAIQSIVSLVITIVKSILEALWTLIPEATEMLLDLLLTLLRSIADNIQPIVEAFIDIFVGIINGMAVGIPKLVTATIDLLKEVIDLIVDAIGQFDLADVLKAAAALAVIDGMLLLVAAMAVEALVATAPLPTVGKNLSGFAEKATPFFNSIKHVDSASLQSVSMIGQMILAMSSASILDAVSSWISGENPLEKYAQELVDFAPYIVEFSNKIRGIDPEAVKAAAAAGMAITEFASSIPNRGGLVASITGENSITDFAVELAAFAPVFVSYSDAMKNVDSDVIVSSSNAALSLCAFADNVPNRGGIVSWIAGENSLSDFAQELAVFGPVFAEYSDSMKRVDPDVVTASSKAAESLGEFADKIPNSGGILSWIAGDNSLADFAEELAAFGPVFAEYSESVKNVNPDVITSTSAAASSLAEFADKVPNSGGLVSWIVGDGSLSDFASELADFGPVFAEYANAISGVDADIVTKTANAALSLAAFASDLPNHGGIASWFAGDNTLSDLAEELEEFAPGFARYSKIMTMVDPEIIVATSNAAKTIGEFASSLPNHGGMVAWFAGDNSLSDFGAELAEFGPNFAAYAASIETIKPDIVVAASSAATSLAEFAAALPDHGGIVSWITGDSSLTAFGIELASFGPHFNDYYESTKNIDGEKIKSSASAAKVLNEFAETLPEHGGIMAWITGDSSLTAFGTELAAFGPKFAEYSKSVEGVNPDTVVSASSAAKSLSEFASSLPKHGGITAWLTGEAKLTDFGAELASFGPYFSSFYESTKDINSNKVQSAALAAQSISDFAKTLPYHGGIIGWIAGDNSLADFGAELASFGPGFARYARSVESIDPDIVVSTTSAATSLSEFASGLPEHNKIVEWLTGGSNLTAFGTELAAFGPHFSEFYESTKDVDSASVGSSASAAKSLAEFADALPEHDNIIAWITGNNSLETFGTSLAAFGPHFSEFYESTKNVDSDKVKSAAAAAQVLSEFGAIVPPEGGFLQIVTGNNDIAAFGAALAEFAPNFVKFAEETDGINSAKVKSSGEALVAIASAAAEIANSDNKNIFNWWANNTSLSGFGTNLVELGKNIKEYSDELEDLDLNVIDSATTVINTLVTAIPDEKGIALLAVFGTNLEEFSGKLGDFIDDIVDASEDFDDNKTAISKLLNGIKQFVADLVNTDVNSLNKYTETLIKVAENMCSGFSSAIEKSIPSVSEHSETMAYTVIEEVYLLLPKYKEAGEMMMAKVVEGIRHNDVTSSVEFIVKTCISYLKGYHHQFYEAGTYLVEGFMQGITGGKEQVESTSTQLGQAAINGLNHGIAASSPSKKAFQSGTYVISGFSNALIEGIRVVKSASSQVGEASIDTLSNSISSIVDLVSEDVDTSIVITPVLDLSSIRKDARSLNAIITRNHAYSISSMLGETGENGAAYGPRTTVQFNQYNYSPKALDQLEIYRNTNNQLSRFRRAVQNT